MKQVTVLAPAKLNLTLDVVGLLPGGYHALDMIMQAITLHERVTLRKSRDLILRLPGSRVPPNEKNTAWKAALAFFHYTGLLRAWRAAAPTPPPCWWASTPSTTRAFP